MASRRNKATIAPTTTSPAKMGEEMAHAQSVSAQSPNLKYAPRKGGKSDAPVGTASGGRTPTISPDSRVPWTERLGAKFAPQVAMSGPVSPEAAQTQRNVRLVNSAVGNRDFYLRRQYGQGM
jgi:hypothetical protein